MSVVNFTDGRTDATIYPVPVWGGDSVGYTMSSDLGISLKAGNLTIRVELTPETARTIVDTLTAWYGGRVASDEQVATDLTTQEG